jgi:Ca2+-binding EF-hand superfamily protein
MCAICEVGYTRDTTVCNACDQNSFVLRVVVVFIFVLIGVAALVECRKRQAKNVAFRKYHKLWRDLVRVMNINVTFAQINSSMTTVIDIPWPIEWHNFLKYFNFVNIDVAQMLGISCIGDFNFYINFIGMCCVPLFIALLSQVHFIWSSRTLSQHFKNASESDREAKKQESLQWLFDLVDVDHSGRIEPPELLVILKELDWRLSLDTLMEILENDMTVRKSSRGHVEVSKQQFLRWMTNGELKVALENSMLARYRKRAGKGAMDPDQLVLWSMKRQNYSNSLSLAIQLLLLAHTPLSTKVFRYFDCKNLGGKKLMMSDPTIECWTNRDGYNSFLPVVLLVMGAFTFGLPAILSIYLFRHRHELYSAKVYQRIGWMYEAYTKGSEWWQIHDVILKMLLTGLLIYIPTTSRAACAALICMITVASVNYFHPHKNNVLFWLTQLSFMMTGAKYIVALAIVANLENPDDIVIIGRMLIGMDVAFIVGSCIAMVLAVVMVKKRVDAITSDLKYGASPRTLNVQPSREVTASLSMAQLRAAIDHDNVVKLQEKLDGHRDLHAKKVLKRKRVASKRLRARLNTRQAAKMDTPSGTTKGANANSQEARNAAEDGPEIDVVTTSLEKQMLNTFRPKLALMTSRELLHKRLQVRFENLRREKMKVLGKEDVETMSQQIGSENDVVITNSEKKRLNTFRQKLASVSRERLLKVFDKLDQDQSGCLSLEEFRRLVLVIDKGADENFVRILWGKCGGEELGRMEFEVLWLYLHRKSATK